MHVLGGIWEQKSTLFMNSPRTECGSMFFIKAYQSIKFNHFFIIFLNSMASSTLHFYDLFIFCASL